MNMIYMLIGFSILLALLFLLAFFWASKSGQHDDLFTPGIRILFEEEDHQETSNEEKSDEDHLGR
ncbi:cbb3-type cytochrome oxidase maturation protein [Pedobacter cryoconitis]|uniref:Cbb3-type cytochrome oxidase maturation protein n=1 Tax=Pedobacter cryoconitis TaxID=188932 RepID=A0A7W9DWR7_9SPHI|nr:cbb3-type cytochrome oxidase assembly protein CcoS [Pedobacter cryoconitis]MBB5634131.1 cbb3-type cytochrome oxidase maturation protein [Pedobacter cryoconitis]MBB6272750.1 cbb3-type cytochrome oxidase maturation protein [Pedobacter cryoconitis]